MRNCTLIRFWAQNWAATLISCDSAHLNPASERLCGGATHWKQLYRLPRCLISANWNCRGVEAQADLRASRIVDHLKTALGKKIRPKADLANSVWLAAHLPAIYYQTMGRWRSSVKYRDDRLRCNQVSARQAFAARSPYVRRHNHVGQRH